jgi:hypothetical protein
LKDTETPVTIDNDASIRPTTTVKNSKPGILGYIKDKLNEITSVHGPDTQTGVLEPWVREQLLFRAQIEEMNLLVWKQIKLLSNQTMV